MKPRSKHETRHIYSARPETAPRMERCWLCEANDLPSYLEQSRAYPDRRVHRRDAEDRCHSFEASFRRAAELNKGSTDAAES